MTMLVEFVLNGRVVRRKEREKEAECPQGLQKEFAYSGATLLHVAWNKFWCSQLSLLVALNSLSYRSF